MRTPDWQTDDGAVRLYLGDCLEILPTLEAGSVDAVVTDPPYGLGDRLTGGIGGEWSKGFAVAPDWDREIASPDFICSLPDLGECIIWGGNYYPLPPVRGWLSWDKMQEHTSGHFELAWSNLDIPTRVFRLSRVESYSRMDKQHPTQKPVALMDWCLSLFSIDSRTILDPFAGSFTTAISCIRTGRRFIGIEREPKYFADGVNRIEAELRRAPLFEPAPAIQRSMFAEAAT